MAYWPLIIGASVWFRYHLSFTLCILLLDNVFVLTCKGLLSSAAGDVSFSSRHLVEWQMRMIIMENHEISGTWEIKMWTCGYIVMFVFCIFLLSRLGRPAPRILAGTWAVGFPAMCEICEFLFTKGGTGFLHTNFVRLYCPSDFVPRRCFNILWRISGWANQCTDATPESLMLQYHRWKTD